jgi:hypothetical protein
MSKLSHLIEIVYDSKKRKLRARSIQDGRWVRFPNKLRKENYIYEASKMTAGNGDSWIAGGEIRLFPITHEKNLILEEALNIKNKGLLKQFYSVIVNDTNKKVNTEMMNIIFLVKKIFPEIDEQLLQPLIKSYQHSAFISSDLLIPLQNMLKSYNEKRVVSLFANYKEDDFLEDTVIMYERLFNNDLEINNILPESPKSIRELHSIFSRECSKIKTPKNSLNQKLPHLVNQKLNDLEFFIPDTSHDLINIGNSLSICVGNGYYAEKIIKKQSSVVALKNSQGKFVYCIEFHKGYIIQARGFANKDMDSNLKKQLLEKIQDTKNLAA